MLIATSIRDGPAANAWRGLMITKNEALAAIATAAIDWRW